MQNFVFHLDTSLLASIPSGMIVKDVSWRSSGPSSGLMIHWQDPSSCALSCDLTAEGHKAESAKGKGTWDEVPRNPGSIFQESCPSGVT